MLFRSSMAEQAEIVVFENRVPDKLTKVHRAILILDRPYLGKLAGLFEHLAPVSDSISLKLRNTYEYSARDLEEYEAQLSLIRGIASQFARQGRPAHLNVLTDRHGLQEMQNCEAGVKNFALAPNGLIYVCPAFYYADPDSAVGNLDLGIDWEKVDLCRLEKAPLCSSACTAYHCRRCVFENKLHTGEINTPARSQCLVSHVELRQSSRLLQEITQDAVEPYTVDCLDPFERFSKKAFQREV